MKTLASPLEGLSVPKNATSSSGQNEPIPAKPSPVAIIKSEIAALVADGVPYIQMDEPRYSYYVDPKWRQHLRDLGEDPDRMFDEAIAAED